MYNSHAKSWQFHFQNIFKRQKLHTLRKFLQTICKYIGMRIMVLMKNIQSQWYHSNLLLILFVLRSISTYWQIFQPYMSGKNMHHNKSESSKLIMINNVLPANSNITFLAFTHFYLLNVVAFCKCALSYTKDQTVSLNSHFLDFQSQANSMRLTILGHV